MNDQRVVRGVKLVAIAVLWLFTGYYTYSVTAAADPSFVKMVAGWGGTLVIAIIGTYAILSVGTSATTDDTGGRQ